MRLMAGVCSVGLTGPRVVWVAGSGWGARLEPMGHLKQSRKWTAGAVERARPGLKLVASFSLEVLLFPRSMLQPCSLWRYPCPT